MRIYSASQENMVFLSPYTIVRFEQDGLNIYSTLFDTAVTLPCEPRQAQMLLALLQQGATEETLAGFFQAQLPEIALAQLLDDWMRKGVLE